MSINNFPTKSTRAERIKIEKKNVSIPEKINEYNFLISKSEEFLNTSKLKIEGANYENFISELKNVYLNLSNCLFDNKEFKECIKIDKKILKIDPNFYKCYERLYKCYCKIGEESNGLIFGSMLKFKCSKKMQENEYKNLIEEIDKKMKFYVENNKNFSFFSCMKKKDIFQFVIFILCGIYLIYGFFHKNFNFN
jgi:tetratricopeptide (TPR) repeat protein